MTMRWRGQSARSNTVSLVRCGVSARPGIAGSAGDEPVAMTKRRAAMVNSPAVTVRASKNRAAPSMIRTPRPAKRCRVSLGATVSATSRRWAFTAAKSTPKRAALRPKCAALRMILARSAVTASAAAGTLPPLPAPPVIAFRVPFSISTTGTPKAAAADAAARPAAPAPMTQMSGLSSCLSSCVIGLTHPRDSPIARNAVSGKTIRHRGLAGARAARPVTLTGREGFRISRANCAPIKFTPHRMRRTGRCRRSIP